MHNAVFCFCVIYGYKVIAKPCNLNYIILFHCNFNLYCYRLLQLECVILTSPGLAKGLLNVRKAVTVTLQKGD